MTTEKIDEIFEKNYIFLENGDDFCESYKLARRINISISRKHLSKCISVIKENFGN
jgi:bifunctional pyridoxal-dependent enzyme with beta-cystathionase and maltose regulon repressor activities